MHGSPSQAVNRWQSLDAHRGSLLGWTLGGVVRVQQELGAEFHREQVKAKKNVDDLTERVVKSRKELVRYEQGPPPPVQDTLLCKVYTDEASLLMVCKILRSVVSTRPYLYERL